MMLGRGSAGNTAFLRLVLPALVGVLVILGLVAVPVFTSNFFIYRNAFGLSVSKVAVANGAMVADGLLEIRKAGNYAYFAPRFVYGGDAQMSEPEPAMEYWQITWGTGRTAEERPSRSLSIPDPLGKKRPRHAIRTTHWRRGP